jgi:hypothetical protein
MTRAGCDIADGFQPGAAQAGIYRSIGAQRGHRQRLDRISFLAVTDDATMDVTIHRPRAHRGAGDGGADGKALSGQDVTHPPHHRGLAAEQMDTAGDVEKQAMRSIDRHQRREAVAPVGNGIQSPGVGRFIGIEHP